MTKLPIITISEALNILRPYIYKEDTSVNTLSAFNTIETALLQNHDKPWHLCSYEDGELFQDGSWVSGKWYEWLDEHNNREVARMKEDTLDHFVPHTRVISEENVIAFREIDGEKYE